MALTDNVHHVFGPSLQLSPNVPLLLDAACVRAVRHFSEALGFLHCSRRNVQYEHKRCRGPSLRRNIHHTGTEPPRPGKLAARPTAPPSHRVHPPHAHAAASVLAATAAAGHLGFSGVVPAPSRARGRPHIHTSGLASGSVATLKQKKQAFHHGTSPRDGVSWGACAERSGGAYRIPYLLRRRADTFQRQLRNNTQNARSVHELAQQVHTTQPGARMHLHFPSPSCPAGRRLLRRCPSQMHRCPIPVASAFLLPSPSPVRKFILV